MAIFDEISGSYDSWYNTKLGAFADKVEAELVMGKSRLLSGMQVLDAGCGTGNFSIKLAKLGCRVTGIDVSSGMLEEALKKQKEYGGLLDFKVMDVYSIDFPDNYFDAAFSMAQFEFLEDREKALNELLRVVKPGGRVTVGTINRESAWGRLYMTDECRSNTIFKYARLMSIDELASLRKQNLIDTGTSLFIPPDAAEEDICDEREKKLTASNAGGFICAVWEK